MTTPNIQCNQTSKSLVDSLSPSELQHPSRKSERLEKQNSPSPAGKLCMNEKKISTPNQSVKEPTLSTLRRKNKKKKKLKELILVTTVSKVAALDQESVMTGRAFKALFKIQRMKVVFPDVDEGNVTQPCNRNSSRISSQQMEIGEDTCDEFNKKVQGHVNNEITEADEYIQNTLRGSEANLLRNDASTISNQIDDVMNDTQILPDRGDVKNSKINSRAAGTCCNKESLAENVLNVNSVDDPVAKSLVCRERLLDCDIRPKTGCTQTKMAETMISSSAKRNSPSLLRTCVICHKKKRLHGDSHEKGLCSCNSVGVEDRSKFCASKDTTPEHTNVLPLLDNNGEFEKLWCLNSDHDVNLDKSERLSSVKSYESSFEVSKFIEYWVPAQISNHQLELYCDALFNSIVLRSGSKKSDTVGASRDVLLTVQKCCDHPYLVDSSMQRVLFAEQRPVTEILDIGIKASGKLHLLDLMLTGIMTRRLKVLILYQMIVGPEGASMGDILDDFIRQRFGENTYERVDARVIASKKQAAIYRFNKKESEQFIFLLESRACSSSIKLSSLDLIIIYDSDWNPANDFRALQKISIDSKLKQIKVFRLYSSCTVEERALVLAKQNLNLDRSLQNLSRTTVDNLLMWGASYLFMKLDKYHADSSSSSLNIESGKTLLNEVVKDFHAIISDDYENVNPNVLISKVMLDRGSYKTNNLMLGEDKVNLIDGIEPHVFWRNLLDRKTPQWKHLSGPCSRNRKRARSLVGLPRNSVGEIGDLTKKRKILLNIDADLATAKEPLTTVSRIQSGSLLVDGVASKFSQSTSNTGFDTSESVERLLVVHKQTGLHSVLSKKVTSLCQFLKLSEDVMRTVRSFLDFVIENHGASSESPAIMQAFLLSLCWIAASILKQKVDKKQSLILAKQLLNYQCTEEQVNSVYVKMKSQKLLYCLKNSVREGLLVNEGIDKELHNVNEEMPVLPPLGLKNVKIEIEENFLNEENVEAQIPLLQKLEVMAKAAGSDDHEKMKKIHKKCVKRMKKLIQKQREEVQKLQRTWEDESEKFEADHKLELDFARSIHGEDYLSRCKLNRLDDLFMKKKAEHNLLKDTQLKDLLAKQLAARDEENQRMADWVVETIAGSRELTNSNGLQTIGFQSENVSGCAQSIKRISNLCPQNAVSTSPQPLDDQNLSKAMCVNGNDESFDTTVSVPEAVCFVNSHNEPEVMVSEISLPTAVLFNHSIDPNDASRDNSFVNPPLTDKHISDEIEVGMLNREAPTDIFSYVPNNVSQHAVPIVLSSLSNEGDLICLPNSTENHCDAPNESSNCGSPFPDQQVVHSEQMATSSAMPVNVSHSCNQFLPDETEPRDQVHVRSSQTTAAAETEEPIVEASKLNYHVGLGPACRIDHEKNVELFPGSPNNTAATQEMENASELPDQLEIDAGHFHGPSHSFFHLIHQSTSGNSTPLVVAEPLQNEFEILGKEVEQLEITLNDMVSQLRSDYENEIQEATAQIRDKYEVMIKDAEMKYIITKNEMKEKQNKIRLNKILAEAFRLKNNLKPYLDKKQDFPSSFVQHLRQVSMPSDLGSFWASTCQPFPSHQNTNLSVQALQQLPLLCSPRSSPVTGVMLTTSRALQHSMPLSSRNFPKVDVISALTSEASSCVDMANHSPASHLEHFSPSMDFVTSTSQHHAHQVLQSHLSEPQLTPSSQLESSNVASQMILEPQNGMSQCYVQQLVQTPPPATSARSATSNELSPSLPAPSIGQPCLNPSRSATDLIDMNRHVLLHPNLPPLPDVDTTFSSLEPLDFDNLDDVSK